jgi:hypothetical protein
MVDVLNSSLSGGSSKLVLGLLGAVGLLALDLELGLLLVELHKLSQIELGLLEELDLADKDILEREDLLALLGDLLAKSVLNAILYNY